MSRNFIVYQSRNRMTGTLTQTLDTAHPKSTIPNERGRYVARCVEHGTDKRFVSHYDAGRAIAHVDEWCKRCKAMIAKGTKVKTASVALIGDMVGGLNGDRHAAFDKRHNDKPKSGRSTVRKNDQAEMHEIATRRKPRKTAKVEAIQASEAVAEVTA